MANEPPNPDRPAAGPGTPTAAPPPRPRRRRWSRIIIPVVAILVLFAVLYYWFFMRPYESTDDAFIEADVIPIAPQVPGQVANLAVRDNQSVRQGELLVE